MRQVTRPLTMLAPALWLVLLIGCHAPKPETPQSIALAKTLAKADQEFTLGEYGPAVKDYTYAVVLAEDVAPTRVNAIKKRLGATYEQWALKLSYEGRGAEDLDKYKVGIALLERGAEVYPPRRRRCEDYRKRLEKEMKAIAYRKKVSAEAVDPGYKERDEKIAVLMKQGQVCMQQQLYSQAVDKFEQVLLLNPYHLGAVREMRKLYKKSKEIASQRREATRMERLAEEEWSYVNPIEREEDEQDTLADAVGMTPLEMKLANTIIPKLAFEKTRLDQVFTKLEALSRENNNGDGVTFAFENIDPTSDDFPTITFATEAISLGEAVNTICKHVGLRAVPVDNVVVIRR